MHRRTTHFALATSHQSSFSGLLITKTHTFSTLTSKSWYKNQILVTVYCSLMLADKAGANLNETGKCIRKLHRIGKLHV